MKDLNNELPAPVSSENILLCPGNHDFARATIDLPRSMAPDFIYNKSEHTVTYSEFYKSIYNIAPNRYFATGRKLLLSSGHMLEIAALNSVILQQYPNFEGHGYLTQEQLDFVAKEMKWDDEENQNAIRIVMMHHHYLPDLLCGSYRCNTLQQRSIRRRPTYELACEVPSKAIAAWP